MSTSSPAVDLDELFDRDPLNLSTKDIEDLAAHYRAEAKAWQANPSRGKKEPVRMPKNLNLADLGL